MHPDLFTIPIIGVSIKTYGFFLTVGFLSAVWLGMRRATRVKADPDRILDLSFLSLLFGVGGARLFYVAHYWQSDFAHRPNKLFAIVDIRQGGLEFLGGFLGAVLAAFVYMKIKKVSIRLYLDILAPSAMWGLAFGRIGCFFNGCCFGGLCVVAPGQAQPGQPWAVQFPYGSPAQVKQWEDRKVTVPAELIITRQTQTVLVPASSFRVPIEKIQGPENDVRRLIKRIALAKEKGEDQERIAELQTQLEHAKDALKAAQSSPELAALRLAQQYRSRVNPDRAISVSELAELAQESKSLPVHPTQLYSSIHALLLSGLLSAIFYRRKRHGIVIALIFVLYPLARIPLELIRADNPHDVGGMTISQFVSLGMCLAGLVYIFYLYKFMPERSPYADAEPVRAT